MRLAGLRPSRPIASLTLAVVLCTILPPARAHGASWNLMLGPGPGVGQYVSVVWDDVRGRVLYPESYALWSLTPTTGRVWTKTALVGGLPRQSACTAFDAQGDRLLILVDNDIYQLPLNGIGWELFRPAGQPPPMRDFATWVVDPVGHRLIMFGGGANGTQYNDLYQVSLDANPTWTRLIDNDGPGSPNRRERHSTIYDPVRHRIVIFGGVGPGGFFNDVWALPLDGPPVWQHLTTAGSPPRERDMAAAVYDAASDRMIIMGGLGAGGYGPDVWALPFTGSPQWALLPSLPNSLFAYTAVYDPAGRRVLLPTGGSTMALSLASTPYWFDFERRIWAFTRGSAAVGDRTLVVLTGSESGDAMLMLDLSRPDALFTAFGATLGPWGRVDMATVWDSGRSRVLTYGGVKASTGAEYSDLWSLTLSPWHWNLEPTPGVPPGNGWRAVFDPSGDRLVLLSVATCCSPPALANAIYTAPLSGPGAGVWTRHDVFPPSYVGRRYATFTYDPTHDVAWIYGGEDVNQSSLGDVWQVSLSGTPTVTEVAVAGTPPDNRGHHAAVFDEVHDRLVVVGGKGAGGTALSDAWQLEPDVGNHWSPLNLTNGPSPPPRYDMTFAHDPISNRMLMLAGKGSGIVDYWTDVWALDLSETNPVGIAPSQVPSAALSVSAASAPGRIRLRLQLPSGTPATLAMFDLAGRRVWSREVGHLGAGTHEVDAEGAAPRAGIYFVRLSQGGDSRTSRVAVFD